MTTEEKLQKAHQMFDNRNLLTELKWQREHPQSGYVSNQEELFNIWIFDECIKALEQTTKNDLVVDCVSREQAIEALEDDAKKYRGFMEMESYLPKDAIGVIQSLPPVTPQEPRKGHWMESNIGGAKVCSVCNAHMGLSSFKFCPNCGADMREGEE